MGHPRTTESAVRKVIATSLDTGQVTTFIADAGLWVSEEFVASGLTEERLELIERYLACAFIRLRDLGLKSVKFDDIQEQYQVDPDVTDYLLRAASFDPTGTVRKTFMAPKETRVAAAWVGKGFIDEPPVT